VLVKVFSLGAQKHTKGDRNICLQLSIFWNRDREYFLLILDEKGKITLLRHDLILMPLLLPNFSKATI
jgi:hypothetical protein